MANGALLRADSVDRLSLVFAPRQEGEPGGPAVFDVHGARARWQ